MSVVLQINLQTSFCRWLVEVYLCIHFSCILFFFCFYKHCLNLAFTRAVLSPTPKSNYFVAA